MKKLLLFVSLMVTTAISVAQIQQGIVKTNGRPNKPGSPLANVSVKASGRNASLSADDGTFSISMNGLKNGESFFLTSVIKSGYELADRNAVGRKYVYSSSVPVVLTMISKIELEEEKQRIRNNAIEATQKQYLKRVEELERKLDESVITEEVFSKQLQELQKKMDQYNNLIEDLADKYARTDYDQIDTIDLEINMAIENGLFDKADSLIRSKGDITERHQKVIEWNTSSKKQKEAIDRQFLQWETSESLRIKELENLADDYYHSFTIEVSRMHPEVAVKWLEKRLELDPDRFEWLMAVAKYYLDYLGQSTQAMEYYNRAYRIAQKAKRPSDCGAVLNEQGRVYSRIHELVKARKCFNEALHHAEKDSNLIASTYTNLGCLEDMLCHYEKAIEYYEKSLAAISDTLSQGVMNSYANMSTAYGHLQQFDQAEKYWDKAIDLAIRFNNHRTLSTCYSNKGSMSFNQGKDDDALYFYEKALSIRKKYYAPTHPDIALALRNISSVYHNMSRFKESMDYQTQALIIFQNTYGEKHPQVASSYGEIAILLLEVGLYDKALSFARKSWKINSLFYSDTSFAYAYHCNVLGRIYDGLKQDSLALYYYLLAKELFDTIGMNSTTSYTTICNNIAISLYNQGKYDAAIEQGRKNLALLSRLKGKNSNSYITCLNNLASMYEGCGQIDSALAISKESERLTIKTYGYWHKTLCSNYNNIGSLYQRTKEYVKAREYFMKSLEICDSIYKQPSELSMTILSNIAMTYYNDGKWRESIPWMEKAIPIRLQLVKEENRRFAYHGYIYNCYFQLSKSGEDVDVHNFKECQDSLWFKVFVKPDGLASTKYGLKGEYIMLRFMNWEQGGLLNLNEEAIQAKNDDSWDIIVYKDGKIEKVHFDDKVVGISWYLISISQDESQEIKSAYSKWKEENVKLRHF